MPGRGPSRRSRLRHLSTSSNDTIRASSASRSVDGTKSLSIAPSGPIVTSLWIHDDNFSKEEVLINPDIFDDGSITPGALVEIVALKATSDIRDFQQKSNTLTKTNSGTSDHDDIHSKPDATRNARVDGGYGQSGTFNVDHHSRYLCIAKQLPAELKIKHPALQISLTSNIASTFGFRNRSQVVVSIAERSRSTASHVELVFRDEYMARSDMWRLVSSEFEGKTVYKGQKILFLGTIKALVNYIYIGGRKVSSAYFSEKTVPVFRSESARYVLFIQMSKEMWDFDSEGTGEIMFNRVINGFLPDLFKRWADLEVKHLVSIVMFTRLEYDQYSLASLGRFGSSSQRGLSSTATDHAPTKDFYRVVVTDMASGQWTTILNELKKECRVFLRDVSLQRSQFDLPMEGLDGEKVERPKARICGRPSTALRGNILEAINIASSQFASDYIDRDLVHTGISVVIITPGTGVFEVDRDLLNLTSDNLTNNGLGIDLVCLSKMPLHSVPLFKYRDPLKSTTGSVVDVAPPFDPQAPLRPTNESVQSLKLGISPSAPTTYGSMPRSLSRFGSSIQPEKVEDWSFGLPQWIDLSYWVSSLDANNQQFQNRRRANQVEYANSEFTRTFTPTVRMYELQMMGLMELGLANISIPYISEGPYGGRRATVYRPSFSYGRSPESPRHRPNAKREHRADSLVPTRYKNGLLSAQAKQQGSIYDRMDDYDKALFITRPTGRRTKAKKSRGIPHDTVSIQGDHEKQSRMELKVKKRLGEENRSEVSSLRSEGKNKVTSTTARMQTPKTVSAPKMPPSRISRSISYALRGLAPAPRASASIEINVENAKAEPRDKRVHSNSRSASSSDTLRSSGRMKSRLSTDSDNSDHSDSSQTVDPTTPSRPISIKTPIRKLGLQDRTPKQRVDSPLSRAVTRTSQDQVSSGVIAETHDKKAVLIPEDSAKSENSETALEPPQSTDMSAWIKRVYPSNPVKNHPDAAAWFGRWQHLYPRTPRLSTMKWRSLCTPASVPLTTEVFPSARELEAEYEQKPYSISRDNNTEPSEVPKSRDSLLREMIALRLAHGYQLVVGQKLVDAMGPNVLDVLTSCELNKLADNGSSIFMSMGNCIQRLAAVNEPEVHVTKYVRQPPKGRLERIQSIGYSPSIRTILSETYTVRPMKHAGLSEEYPWSLADAYLAGHKEHNVGIVEQLRFWRARFVLIPVEPPASARRPVQSVSEDNEEEIHLLGIRALTQMWQRYRYVPMDERKFKPTTGKRKDPNPLEIIFETLNPSEVVATEIDKLLAAEYAGEVRPAQLLPDSERMERGTTSMLKLAQAMQSEKGVEIVSRRWHLRLHYNCFKGDDFTTWLTENFKDIDSRSEAVDFGNELMSHSLFQHVEKRHNFKDGNYFYQIDADYRTPRVDTRNSWFPSSRRSDKSVPSTPITEHVSRDSAFSSIRSRSGSNLVNEGNDINLQVKQKGEKRCMSISLSKVMRLDVDHRKRSDRPEVINLHYDRLHNPENCYHLELSWINVTSKLVEDAIVGWATQAEKYGLKLVEVPVAEASSISAREPFRNPFRISLKIPPPSSVSSTNYQMYFTSTSFTPQPYSRPDPHMYQKAILKRFGFILDLEAASDFPPDVDVTYSWGKLEYRYPQFVHRSGMLLAQITDSGDFLLVANRLYNTRSTSAKDAAGKFDPKRDLPPGSSRSGGAPASSQQQQQQQLPPLQTSGILNPNASYPSPHPSPLVRASSGEALSSNNNNNNNNNNITTTSNVPSLLATGIPSYNLPVLMKSDLEAFCNDEHALTAFYKEITAVSSSSSSSSVMAVPVLVPRDPATRKSASTGSSALRPVREVKEEGTGVEMSIPDLRLPASVVTSMGNATAAAVLGLSGMAMAAANKVPGAAASSTAAAVAAAAVTARRVSPQPGERVMRGEDGDGGGGGGGTAPTPAGGNVGLGLSMMSKKSPQRKATY